MTQPATLKKALSDLQQALPNGLRQLLRPSLTRDVLNRIEMQLLPWKLPEDVRDLLQWHDGAEEPFA